MKEPQLHSQITGALPDDHDLAGLILLCDACGTTVQDWGGNVAPWVESGGPVLCLPDFVESTGDVFPDMATRWALD